MKLLGGWTVEVIEPARRGVRVRVDGRRRRHRGASAVVGPAGLERGDPTVPLRYVAIATYLVDVAMSANGVGDA